MNTLQTMLENLLFILLAAGTVAALCEIIVRTRKSTAPAPSIVPDPALLADEAQLAEDEALTAPPASPTSSTSAALLAAKESAIVADEAKIKQDEATAPTAKP